MNGELAEPGRRIVVTGASGNLGTGLLRRLAADLPDADVVGVCRRPPPATAPYDRVHWHKIDLAADSAAAPLEAALQGATAVVHLAWAIQPVRSPDHARRTNLNGTRALLRAIHATGVPHLVYASSIGALAPAPRTDPVDETWPDSGQRSSTYSRQKVTVERIIDHFERENPNVTVARIRPTLVVQRAAAHAIKDLFLGPLAVRPLLEVLRRGILPAFPMPAGLALQLVHADDVGDAVVRILRLHSSGVFHLAADGLDTHRLAGLVGARPIELPPHLLRAVVTALYTLRALAASPGWFDVATKSPLVTTAKAAAELGWKPARSTTDCARELLDGLADGATGASAALGGRREDQRLHVR